MKNTNEKKHRCNRKRHAAFQKLEQAIRLFDTYVPTVTHHGHDQEALNEKEKLAVTPVEVRNAVWEAGVEAAAQGILMALSVKEFTTIKMCMPEHHRVLRTPIHILKLQD